MPVQTSYGRNQYGASDGHIIAAPKDYQRDGRMGCLYFWGRGNTAVNVLDPAYWNGIARGLADLGMPVGSSDFGSTTHWGNGTSVTRAGLLRTYMVNNWGVRSDKVNILAISMGAVAALNWASANKSLVNRIALITPVVNLAWARTYNGGSEAAQIEAAYGGAAALDAAMPTADPSAYAAELAGIPIRLWYSADDTAPTPQSMDAFVNGSGAVKVSLGNVGHSAGALAAADVHSFLTA